MWVPTLLFCVPRRCMLAPSSLKDRVTPASHLSTQRSLQNHQVTLPYGGSPVHADTGSSSTVQVSEMGAQKSYKNSQMAMMRVEIDTGGETPFFLTNASPFSMQAPPDAASRISETPLGARRRVGVLLRLSMLPRCKLHIWHA